MRAWASGDGVGAGSATSPDSGGAGSDSREGSVTSPDSGGAGSDSREDSTTSPDSGGAGSDSRAGPGSGRDYTSFSAAETTTVPTSTHFIFPPYRAFGLSSPEWQPFDTILYIMQTLFCWEF